MKIARRSMAKATRRFGASHANFCVDPSSTRHHPFFFASTRTWPRSQVVFFLTRRWQRAAWMPHQMCSSSTRALYLTHTSHTDYIGRQCARQNLR